MYNSSIGKSIFYVSVHCTALLVTDTFVHETGIPRPVRLGSLGPFTTMNYDCESLAEFLREETVYDWIDTTVG